MSKAKNTPQSFFCMNNAKKTPLSLSVFPVKKKPYETNSSGNKPQLPIEPDSFCKLSKELDDQNLHVKEACQLIRTVITCRPETF